MGKGSTPRPIPDPETFSKNWDAIFKKPKESTHDDEPRSEELQHLRPQG
jgi:hypothetical protein